MGNGPVDGISQNVSRSSSFASVVEDYRADSGRDGGNVTLHEDGGVETPDNGFETLDPADYAMSAPGIRVDSTTDLPTSESLADKVRHSVRQRSAVRNFFSSIGRRLMDVLHVVKNVVCLDFCRSMWRQTNVDSVAAKCEGQAKSAIKSLPVLSESEKIPVAFDTESVVASMGMRGSFGVAFFETPSENTQDETARARTLFGEKGPSLKDIKQNPDLQDCWFLSTVAGLLARNGADAIKRLFDFSSAPDGFCDVRLGKALYRVPMGDVLCEGKRIASDSAPWVRVLEQAMAMHVVYGTDFDTPEGGVAGNRGAMSFRTVGEALRALTGHENDPDNGPVPYHILGTVSLEEIREMMDAGPVVLGHGAGLGGAIAGVLRDNISPGHAITLVDIGENDRSGKAWLTVLDPYGKVRIISSDALSRCSVNTIETVQG